MITKERNRKFQHNSILQSIDEVLNIRIKNNLE